jgi:hypothetical protein
MSKWIQATPQTRGGFCVEQSERYTGEQGEKWPSMLVERTFCDLFVWFCEKRYFWILTAFFFDRANASGLSFEELYRSVSNSWFLL